METRRVIDRACERAALANTEEAEGALAAVLESMAPGLDETTRELLADALPAAWSGLVRDVAPNPHLDREGFYRAVAAHGRTSAGFGAAHVRCVCQVLAEAAPEDLRERLRELPRGLGELFAGYAPTEAGPQMMPSPHEHLSHRSAVPEGYPDAAHPGRREGD
jgi:uncharacterized protein (DUF2267 family)